MLQTKSISISCNYISLYLLRNLFEIFIAFGRSIFQYPLAVKIKVNISIFISELLVHVNSESRD